MRTVVFPLVMGRGSGRAWLGDLRSTGITGSLAGIQLPPGVASRYVDSQWKLRAPGRVPITGSRRCSFSGLRPGDFLWVKDPPDSRGGDPRATHEPPPTRVHGADVGRGRGVGFVATGPRRGLQAYWYLWAFRSQILGPCCALCSRGDWLQPKNGLHVTRA